ncbi:MAG: hypothetical protein JXA18_10940 [Chitinispirillaceae bacterium]|nr:hypothetical protein [Chitinispirillaceae bacterium]
MRRVTFIAVLISLTIAQTSGSNDPTPITSIGSNPYFSTDLYPQDILMRSGSYLFFSPQYQNRPWWGDVDEPTNKPDNGTDYSITGVDVIRNGGSFKHSAAIHSAITTIGYAHQLRDNLMTSLEFDYTVDAMRNRAEGNFTGDDYPQGKTLPFNYELRHTFNRLSVRGMLGTTIRDIPFGITIDGGFENTLALKTDLAFAKLTMNPDGTYSDSTAYYSMNGNEARAMWGWSESGCNHVFVVHGTQGDTWLQGEYAAGPVYHFNLLSGITLDKVKAGGYFRYKRGHQDQYIWRSSGMVVSNDSILSDNFIGEYVKDDMARISSAGEGRLFGNIRWRGGDRYSLNTFASIDYLDSATGQAAADNLEAESSAKEKIRSFSLECDPNISVKLGEFLNYFDGAILFRYRYSNYSNTYEQGVGGGEVRTFQRGYVSSNEYGWETTWERFSHANENAVDLGADIATMFPLFSGGPHHLSLNLRLFGDVRFTYQKKYFGDNTVSGGDLIYNDENIRKNSAREMMFNTFIMLHYMQGPCHLRLQFIKPVLYSIAQTTAVTDANGDILDDEYNYPVKKSPLWITQKGVTLALYASYDIVFPFLQRSR